MTSTFNTAAEILEACGDDHMMKGRTPRGVDVKKWLEIDSETDSETFDAAMKFFGVDFLRGLTEDDLDFISRRSGKSRLELTTMIDLVRRAQGEPEVAR